MLIARLVAGSVLVGVVVGAGVAFGQTYPNAPIRIVTAPAGGGSDFIARTMAQGMAAPLGQQLIIDNRAGAAIGETTAKAAPDGYTIMVQGANLWILPLLQKTPWDVVRDFATMSLISRQVNQFVVHPGSVPVKTPDAIIRRINQEAVRVLNQPEVRERLLNAGEEIVASTPEQFAATLKAEIAKMSKIIKDAGIKID